MHHSASAIHVQQRFVSLQRMMTHCQSTFNLLANEVLLDEVEKRFELKLSVPRTDDA